MFRLLLLAVMQHRMLKEAQRAMAPWMGGQPVYGPISNASTQMNPLLYAGTHTHTHTHTPCNCLLVNGHTMALRLQCAKFVSSNFILGMFLSPQDLHQARASL